LLQFRKNREDGFTLLEILIVCVVIGVLAGISIPVFNSQKKKAIQATLVADVKNAGLVMQSELLMTNDPYSMLLPNFFISQDSNVLQINHLQSSADFFCIMGSSTVYPDLHAYYDSEKGGMVQDAEACGHQEDIAELPPSSTNGPTDPNPVATTPPNTGVAGETVTQPPKPNQPQPGDKEYIPPAVQDAIKVRIPNKVCEAKIQENIDAYVAMYGSLKYQNLVSVMARLQSGNKDMADILKNTPEGKRAIAASKAIESDPICSKYISVKSSTTTYFYNEYDELTKAYYDFMNNLNENSADSYAYTKAYKKLYERVYGVDGVYARDY
jgi:prepilin-type N-terminal cleavage/methylation domain-containing protein